MVTATPRTVYAINGLHSLLPKDSQFGYGWSDEELDERQDDGLKNGN